MAQSQLSLSKLRPNPDKRVELPLGGGLILLVQPSGKKSFAVRYKHPDDGRSRKLTLGSFRTLALREPEPDDEPQIGARLTLAQAKVLAAAELRKVERGLDPAGELKSTKQAVAVARADVSDHFEVIAETFLRRYARPNQKPRSFIETALVLGFAVAKDGKLALRDADPARKHGRPLASYPALRWRGRKVQAISRRDVNEALDAVVDADAAHASNATFSALRRMFNWCCEQDVVAASPCAGVKKRIATTERDRVLSDDELRLVWLASSGLGQPFGGLFKLLLLTGARRDEWADARWSEIKDGALNLSKERTKNGRPHVVPLSEPALQVLADLAEHRLGDQGDDPIFSTGQGRSTAKEGDPLRSVSGFSKAKARIDRIISEIQAREAKEAGLDPATVKPIPDWRLHDLRRTMTTGLARLGTRIEVSERAINHVSGSFAGVAGVYQRHTYGAEIALALAAWGQGVERIVAGEPLLPEGNVVTLAAAG